MKYRTDPWRDDNLDSILAQKSLTYERKSFENFND